MLVKALARAWRRQHLPVGLIDVRRGPLLSADRIVLLELGQVVRVIDRGAVTVEELQDLVAGRAQLTGVAQ